MAELRSAYTKKEIIEATRLLLQIRDDCVKIDTDDLLRKEKYNALNMAIDGLQYLPAIENEDKTFHTEQERGDNMNMKYTVAFGDTRTESIITFVSKHFHLYEVLSECGYNITEWELCKGICYIEYNGDYLPTGRYFRLISACRTNEEESDEVIFF